MEYIIKETVSKKVPLKGTPGGFAFEGIASRKKELDMDFLNLLNYLDNKSFKKIYCRYQRNEPEAKKLSVWLIWLIFSEL